MQFYVPTDKAAPILRPAFFSGASVAIVNQTTTDVYMSDNPAELDASATGMATTGGIRVANSGGQVLWPATSKVAWFRAILAWVSGSYVFGQTIIDKLGGLWTVTVPASGAAAAASSAAYPFPTTSPALNTTQADGAVTWTYKGPAAIAVQVQPG